MLVVRAKDTESGQTLLTGGLSYWPSNRQVGMGKTEEKMGRISNTYSVSTVYSGEGRQMGPQQATSESILKSAPHSIADKLVFS